MLSPCFSLPVGALCLTLHACLFAFLFQRPVRPPVNTPLISSALRCLESSAQATQTKKLRNKSFQYALCLGEAFAPLLNHNYWDGKATQKWILLPDFSQGHCLILCDSRETDREANRKICQYNDFFSCFSKYLRGTEIILQIKKLLLRESFFLLFF